MNWRKGEGEIARKTGGWCRQSLLGRRSYVGANLFACLQVDLPLMAGLAPSMADTQVRNLLVSFGQASWLTLTKFNLRFVRSK